MPPGDLQALLKGPALIPTAPRDVAVGIPADLLRRRPDIRQAEFQAIAQGALIGVAKADLYPHFGIGGAIGYSAGDGANLFTANSLAAFFTPFTFSWDIFNYGRIKNNVRAQDALFEQMLVNYQNAVLNAAKEVEDALVGFLRSKDQVFFLTDAVKASQRAVDLALLQYKEGIVDYTRVLNTQQSLLVQQENLVISQGDLPRYLIGVYKALGGGWQIRQGKDIIPEKTLKVMRERTDWGNLLPGKPLPVELKQPPMGKEVGLFNKPEW
jgi:outer membrane protein TolC